MRQGAYARCNNTLVLLPEQVLSDPMLFWSNKFVGALYCMSFTFFFGVFVGYMYLFGVVVRY